MGVGKKKPLFWLNILLVFITGTLLLRWQLPVVNGAPSDFRLRVWGMALQLIGAYTVWKDLSSTAQSFGKGDVIYSSIKWLKAGFWRRSIVLEGAVTFHGSSFFSGRTAIHHSTKASATVEERLAALEQYYKYINDNIDEAVKKISTLENDMKIKFDEQKANFTSEFKATHARMDEGFTGSYGMLLFGVCWLCFGIIFASIAPEIAKVMAGQWDAIWLAL
ncbi:MAG: hypothetical protein ACOH2K_13255 [Burkholderiaceae bacterium]